LHRGDDIDRNADGLPITNVEVKVDEEGEILVRGKGLFVGYYKNEDATEEALRNGWFHTGDWGNINERGHIVVFDRLKDAVSLKSGHKFAPQYIESQLKFSPYINDAVVIRGENYEYVTVIINIEFANVSKWADKNHINYLTFTDLSQKDEVYDLIHEEIKKVNRNLPPETRVKRFANLYKQLDPDEAELTRTRKVKRKVFEERYRPVIDGLYGDERFVEVETEVRYRDGKVSLIKTSVKIRDV
jgi:long-chain acyl-CoA synthetase